MLANVITTVMAVLVGVLTTPLTNEMAVLTSAVERSREPKTTLKSEAPFLTTKKQDKTT